MNRKDKIYHNSLSLKADLMKTLLNLLSCSSTTIVEYKRISIILHYHSSNDSFKDAGIKLGVNRETISAWYHKGIVINNKWDIMVKNALNETGHAGVELRKKRLVQKLISDSSRSGAPATYTIEQYTNIVKIALEKPSEYGRPITNWTARELADEVNKQGIAQGISERQVQRFLSQADLKPHKSRYWLNPNIDNIEEYEQQIREICGIYQNAEILSANGCNIISTDEKTGIQALERIHPSKPMISGKEELIEAEYTRHGTLCLIPAFNVATGKIHEYYIGEKREETDFAEHIKKLLILRLKKTG